MAEITVLIVDDHPVVCMGLRLMLEGASGLEVVGEATSGKEALEKAAILRPSLVLLDLNMPEMDGLETAVQLRKNAPDVHIVMMTMCDQDDVIASALQVGVDGYVLKTATQQELCNALRVASSGSFAIRSQLLRRALSRMNVEGDQSTAAETNPRANMVPVLTERELKAVRLLAQGKTNKEIAREMVISHSTAKKHVEQVLAKLGAADRTEAAIIALRLGLCPASPETTS